MSEILKHWEPLPPRRVASHNRKHSKRQKIELDANYSASKGIKFKSIEENVNQRASMHRAENTLESKDGCAGDFYEYLDHTADVQCHSWGVDLVEAFQNMAPCMLNYMTDITKVREDPDETINIRISGHDMHSLLYNYMNELLFKFCSDSFCTRRVNISQFDKETFSIEATLYGDIFDPLKHPCGTEIKAITYSNMQVHEKEGRADLFVIVDI